MNHFPSSRRDFAAPFGHKPTRKLAGRRLAFLVAAASATIALTLTLSLVNATANVGQWSESANDNDDSSSSTPLEIRALALPTEDTTPEHTIQEPGTGSEIELSAQSELKEVTIRPGDTLIGLLRTHGADPDAAQQLLKADADAARRLGRIRPGEKLKLAIDDGGQVNMLVYEFDALSGLRFERLGEGYRAQGFEQSVDIRSALASGAIDGSLYLAGQEAGLSDRLIMQLVEIFAWDIDFALDVRSGDHFTVAFEEHYVEGEKLRDGEILAAEFVNRDRTLRAVRHVNEQGERHYFTPDGLSMRKAFLRTPVKFGRISSGFNLKRKHPILHKIRAHKGVDYAASIGTPIKASGDGKVIFAGRKGGYGRTVILQHGRSYTTLYAHMSKIAKGIRSGKRVRQGQVIGTVGKSGLATGAHLHYEFRVKGVHKNPLTVKFPTADPIPEQYRAAFLQEAERLGQQLTTYRRSYLALNP